MTRARTIVTAGLAMYVNGARFGTVTHFEFSSSSPRKPVMGLDCLDPIELIPTSVRVTGRIGLVRTHGDGGAEGAGMTTDFANLPRERYFSVMIIERKSDRVLFAADRCSVISQSWQMGAKSMVTGTVEFEGLDWYNEVT